MKAPFPWFGVKSKIAPEVWARFGDVDNYVEPFFGSGAVLLARPEWHARKVETVNDKDGFLTNFWRALQAAPDEVARWAAWPVNEIDLAARRDWLLGHDNHCARMEADPNFYDARMAGVWVWGVCSTIGNAWQPKSTHLGAGMGIHRARTHLGAGRGVEIAEYFSALARRLERVRIMSGDWTRVTSPTVTTHNGLTGMFLDPPYLDDCTATYQHNDDCREAVRQYAIEHGAEMRIALCCYEGEQDMPADWDLFRWKAHGGYGSQGDGAGRVNRHREQIWFSPACIAQGRLDL